MFELFMYVYSYCNALSARFFAVDRALNSYFMIMITVKTIGGFLHFIRQVAHCVFHCAVHFFVHIVHIIGLALGLGLELRLVVPDKTQL